MEVLERDVAAAWMGLESGLDDCLVALRAGFVEGHDEGHGEFLSRLAKCGHSKQNKGAPVGLTCPSICTELYRQLSV